jgi:hypothetical protein
MAAAPAAGAGLVWAEAISAIVAVNMITASHVPACASAAAQLLAEIDRRAVTAVRLWPIGGPLGARRALLIRQAQQQHWLPN